MSDQAEYLYDEDGDAFAQIVAAEDGNLVAISLHDGATVLGASTPDGVALNPGDYAIEADGGSQPVSRAEFEQYAQALAEQQAQQPVYEQPQQDEVGWWQEISDQKNDVEARLGRSLTLAEAEAVAHHVGRQERRGETVDMAAALEDSWRTGAAQPLDLDHGPDRRQYMGEQLRTSEREAEGQDLGEPEPPSRDDYDLNNREQRQAWQIDRLEGRLSDDQAHAAAYDGSDHTE